MQVADDAPCRPVSCPHCDHGAGEARTPGSSQPHALQTESHHQGPALPAILEDLKTPEPRRQSPCRDRHRDSPLPSCRAGDPPKIPAFFRHPRKKKSTPGKTDNPIHIGTWTPCDADDAVAQAWGAIVSRGLGDVCGDDSLSLLQPHNVLNAWQLPPARRKSA